jgi:hypothetical protein
MHLVKKYFFYNVYLFISHDKLFLFDLNLISSHIFVENDHLKIDGLKYAVELKAEPIFQVENSYGMYNSPELNKYNQINFKYHTWYIKNR